MLLDKITVGSTLESLLYAFLNNNYFLPTLKFGPLFYKSVTPRIFMCNRQDFAWSRLQTIMSLSGRLLNYEQLRDITIKGNEIKISSKEGLFKYEFNLCNVFDPTYVKLENRIEKRVPQLFQVIDDFELSNLGSKHCYLQPKISEESFAREIHYYSSSRVDGAKYVTDCVVESLLNSEQINNIESCKIHHPLAQYQK